MVCWIQYKECYKETVNSSLVFGDTALLPHLSISCKYLQFNQPHV